MFSREETPLADAVEVRLFIEELACDICRFTHVSSEGVDPQSVHIEQEVQLAASDAFAVYRKLSDDSQALLHESEPLEAKNVGRIKAWVYEGRPPDERKK